MKKIFTILLLCFIASISDAQTINLKAGTNIANQYPALVGVTQGGSIKKISGEALQRFHAGVSMDVRLTGSWFVRPELMYSGQGYHMHELIDFAGNTQAPAADFKLNYLNLPVHFVYRQPLSKPGNKKMELLIGVGPYAGFLVGGKYDSDGSGSRDVKIGDAADDEFNTFDAGVSGIVGFRINLFFFETGYRQGLTESGRLWAPSKNKVIHFGIGVSL